MQNAMNYKLEICCDSAGSAVLAMNAGADRIELCDNLAEGGTTPSYGSILVARDKLKIGLHVLIRPRSGDFLYNESEMDIIMNDIELCRRTGVDGIVTGVLNPDGGIDTKKTSELIKSAGNMSVTFHRAFDLCSDPVKGLEDIIECGASRLLTSGQQNKAVEGTGLISQLVKQAHDRITIMPGSGLDDRNIEQVAKLTGAREFHMTARKEIVSGMIFRREGIAMGGISGSSEYSRKVADPEAIKIIKFILDRMPTHGPLKQ